MTQISLLTAHFRNILKTKDAVQLENIIDSARAKALEDEFKQTPIPLIFTDSSSRLPNENKT